MEKKVCIGKIVAARGIRGEVKVASYTKNPRDLDKYGAVSNKNDTRLFKIKVIGMSSSNVVVKIEGVNNRNEAEALIGTEFYIKRTMLPDLAEDEYYQTDIVGLKVFLRDKDHEIGTVAGFANYGAGEIIELKLIGQKETELLPFTQQYVPEINIDDGYIIVSSATMVFAKDEEK